MTASRTFLPLVAGASLALLSACTVGPDYTPPPTHAPAAWVEPSPAAATAPSDRAWWTAFNDAELDSLVERAAATNTDLRAAWARLLQARARRGMVAAALLPNVDLDASYTNSRFSENGFLKGLGGPTSDSNSPPGAIGPGQEINLYQIGLDASWEVDVFGGRRRDSQAAAADLQAAGFTLADVRRTVLAEVADGYIQVRGVQTRLGLARDAAESQQRSLAVVREQTRAGVASDLDLARAESQAATSAAAVPALEAAERAAVRRVEVLLAAAPGTLDAELASPAPIPTPPDAAVPIPSEALRRRPDVRAAERRLAAATARIGVAVAEYYPRFSLTGSFGFQSQAVEDLPDGDSRFWLVGPTVRWPILDFGSIRGNVALQSARAKEAEAEYEGAIIGALSDVEVSLVNLARERRRGAELGLAASAADRSERLANEKYLAGVLEYADLLDVQRTRIAAHDAAALSNAAVASASVGLFKALGGGWEVPADGPAVGAAP